MRVMRTPFTIRRRQSYPWWFGSAMLVAVTGFYLLPETRQTSELLPSLLGSIAAFIHFLYRQHNSNTDRFVALFNDFTE